MLSDRLVPLAGFNEVVPFKIRVSRVRAVFSIVLLVSVLRSKILEYNTHMPLSRPPILSAGHHRRFIIFDDAGSCNVGDAGSNNQTPELTF